MRDYLVIIVSLFVSILLFHSCLSLEGHTQNSNGSKPHQVTLSVIEKQMFDAIDKNKSRLVKKYLKKGVDPEIVNSDGLSALELAKKYGNSTIISMIKFSIRKNRKNKASTLESEQIRKLKSENNFVGLEKFILEHPDSKYYEKALSCIVEIVEEKYKKNKLEKYIELYSRIPGISLYVPKDNYLYFIGPAKFEIYHLFDFLSYGLEQDDIEETIYQATGKYKKFSSSEIEWLKRKKMPKTLITALIHFDMIKKGKADYRIIDIINYKKNGMSDEELLPKILANGGMYHKLNKQEVAFLKKKGLSNDINQAISYHSLLNIGSETESIYSLSRRIKNGDPKSAIIADVKKSGGYYKYFNLIEKQKLKEIGFDDHLIYQMIKNTKKYDRQLKIAGNKKVDAYKKKHGIVYNNTVTNYKRNNNSASWQTSGNLPKSTETKKSGTADSIKKAVSNCIAQKLALKACGHIPWPGSLLCNSLARNKFPCVAGL